MNASPGPKPNAVDTHSQQHAAIFQRLFQGIGLLRAGANVAINWDGNQYSISAQVPPSQPSGLRYADPIENDTGLAHAKGEIIHLASTSFLVTTGYKLPSAPTGATVKAKVGKWIAVRDVPAIQNISGVDCYNVPQFPLPGANYDDAARYWDFWPDPVCV
jgi:hypothetical protein